jgi:peptidyl-tRNA hydrolase
MAQSLHAAFGFAHRFPKTTGDWLRDSQFVVAVSVPNRDALIKLRIAADTLGIENHLWHEPDLDNQATALALAPVPDSMRLCSSLPLAAKEKVPI